MVKHTLPTGYLIVDEYSNGKLETLSIGDYGKDLNVKADFLGLTREINGVANRPCKPLSEKWVITLSTQYGCQQSCKFCSVPNIPFRGNVTLEDLKKQFFNAIGCFPQVRYTERLNVHFARCGEPIFNNAVYEFTEWLYNHKNTSIFFKTNLRIEVLHPVLTTSLPKNKDLALDRLLRWTEIKNRMFNGQAGLQFSINSTDETQRQAMFDGKVLTLEEISTIGRWLPSPHGRKYCLNFAFSSDFKINGAKLASLFNPEKFMCKITPIHETNETIKNGFKTVGGYSSYAPYKPVEEELKRHGFDVLVFIPSADEEESTITCGNAILGGDTIKNSTNKVAIEGIV
jgi:23S rRNA (adenine2503-C2)-methyltransferase